MDIIFQNQAIWASIASLFLLLILILRWQTNAFVTLLSCAILAALLAGMHPEAAFSSVQKGMGGTLGFIAPVIGLGALFGTIMEKSGYLESLALRLSGIKSDKHRSFATGFMGLVAAIPVFFDVALIILLPFITKLARKAKKKPLFFGLPLCAGLAIGHAFIPPTPGPIAIAELLGANLGRVILIGLPLSIICLIIAGPIFTIWLDKSGHLVGAILTETPSESSASAASTTQAHQASFPTALALLLLPLILIMAGTIAKATLPDSILLKGFTIIGHPFSALIIACVVSWLSLRLKTEVDKAKFRATLKNAFEPTAAVILVTGAGGAFKQVLVDTGAGAQMAEGLLAWGLTPVLLAFFLALLIRTIQGSATVAMITAAGLMAPIISNLGLNGWQLATLTTAIAAGATGLSHVNDSGFWLVSRLFNLTEKETLKSWTLMTTTISIAGLFGSLLLYAIV
jgi:gluconate transporter